MTMSYEGWTNGIPPRDWPRILATDVGGASAWANEFSATDPWGNVIFYDEVYLVTGDVDLIASLLLPKMVSETGDPLNFRAKVIDYENRIAAEDLRRRGIMYTNAQKHGKAGSVVRLNGYLHPNAKHQFPGWHPRAGQFGSPRMFITYRCKNLIREIPQQKWKEVNSDMRDEPDRSVPHDTWDCALYTLRVLPHPSDLKPTTNIRAQTTQSLMSAMYYADVAKQKERERQVERRPYRVSRMQLDMF